MLNASRSLEGRAFQEVALELGESRILNPERALRIPALFLLVVLYLST